MAVSMIRPFNKDLYKHYVYTQPPFESEAVFLEYVFIRTDGMTLGSKTRVVYTEVNSVQDIPEWACTLFHGVETIIKPVALYNDPFRRCGHKLVLCERFYADRRPVDHNFRQRCSASASHPNVQLAEPLIGIEQEYFLFDTNLHPLGWPFGANRADMTFPNTPPGPITVHGRDLFDAHMSACLYAGIQVAGATSEAFRAQWEYQLGPSPPLKACDDLWMSRFILHRLSEEFGLVVSFETKPVTSQPFISAGHVNISTRRMREEGGLSAIREAIPLLKETHSSFLSLCDARGGQDILEIYEISFFTKEPTFSCSETHKDSCVRIPAKVVRDGCGYLEDRRPMSNMDPYLVVDALLKVIVLRHTQLDNPYRDIVVPGRAS